MCSSVVAVLLTFASQLACAAAIGRGLDRFLAPPIAQTEVSHVDEILTENEKKVKPWNYQHPDLWHKDHPKCKGSGQSPIDIVRVRIGTKENMDVDDLLNITYKPVKNAEVRNNGHSIEVKANFGTFALPYGVYEAMQLHFHFPSEHHFEGVPLLGEMHIVHQRHGSSHHDDLAIVAVMFKDYREVVEPPARVRKSNNILRAIGFGGNLPKEGDETPRIIREEIDIYGWLKDIFKADFYHYQGSLTTPPCAGPVHWYVMEIPVGLSEDTVDQFREAIPFDNSRPVQPVAGREIIEDGIDVTGEFDGY